MDALINVLGALLPLAKAHPWVAVATTVAGFIVLAQPVLRAIVRWTPNTVDDKVAEVIFKVANLLTPKKVKRGEKVAAPVEPAKPEVSPETHSTDPDPDNVPTEN